MSDLAKLKAYTIPYAATGAFSKLVSHYVENNHQLKPFFEHSVSLEGLQQAIANRQYFSTDRAKLVAALQQQYKEVTLNEKQSANLSLLLNNNCFTITTAHQPNIFTGPLYFIYKILHAIKLADYAKTQFPQYHFVPIYYMGSEDADIDELGHTFVDGKKYEWPTKQTGAVGRMKVDNALLQLIQEMAGQIGIYPFGNSFIYLLNQAYIKGRTIQEATLHLVNSLFAEFGLLVVVPDNKILKSLFIQTIQKELFEQFSSKAVMPTIERLAEHYKVQAAGREINLFYLSEGARDRIEKKGERFAIQRLNRFFSAEEIIAELTTNPEAFSPNVILRGVFQETILPNIAFIGGGGELAYWLELKEVFKAAAVPYPVLILRNSFLLMEAKYTAQYQKWQLKLNDIFKSADQLLNEWVLQQAANSLLLDEEKELFDEAFNKVQTKATQIDSTLAAHAKALQHVWFQKIVTLEKKMLRAEKRKHADRKQQLLYWKNALFPNNALQERTENMAVLYSKYGPNLMQQLFHYSLTLEQTFTILMQEPTT